MDDVGGSLGIRNATILMILAGAFHLYLGYTWFQFSVISQWPIDPTPGILMIVSGVLTLCTSLIVWLQKSWATKIIVVNGVAVCGTLIISGFFTMCVILAPIYWVAINQFRQGIVYSDWHED